MAERRQGTNERMAAALEDLAAAVWVGVVLHSPGVNGSTWGRAIQMAADAVRRIEAARGQS